jgi:hypothetical protein
MLETAWSCHEAGPGGFFMLKIDVAAIHGAAEPSRKNTRAYQISNNQKVQFPYNRCVFATTPSTIEISV